MKKKSTLTLWGFLIYAVLNLTFMSAMSFGIFLLAACVLWDMRSRVKFSWQSEWVRSYILVSSGVILACALSLLSFAFFPLSFLKQSPSASIGYRDFLKLLYFFFPILFTLGWKNLSHTNQIKVLRTWIITFCCFSAIGVAQIFTGWPRSQPNPTLPGYFHTSLFFGHHLSTASILIFPFFASLDVLSKKQYCHTLGLNRFFLFLSCLLGLITLVFTYSRTLWFGLVIGLLFWIIHQFSAKKTFILILFLLSTTTLMLKQPLFQNRIHVKMGIDERVGLWKANFIFFQKRPFFGIGFGKNLQTVTDYYQWKYPNEHHFFVGHAHSIYLELLAGLGIVGLIAGLLWLIWIFKALKKPTLFSKGLLSAWIVFCINGLTQVNFWEGKVLHQVMWVTGMLLAWNLNYLTTVTEETEDPLPFSLS